MDNKIKFEVELDPDTGNFTINVFDYLKEMTDEQKDALLYDNGWWPFVRPHLIKALRSGYANESYESSIHEIRRILLTSEFAPEMLRNFLEGLAISTTFVLRNAKRYEQAYYKIYHDERLQHPEIRRAVNDALPGYESYVPRASWVNDFVNELLESNGIQFDETQEGDLLE